MLHGKNFMFRKISLNVPSIIYILKKKRLKNFSSLDAELFVRRKAMSLTVSLGLPVHSKYLMTKPMGFADQCKPSSARPASEARATWHLLLPLLFCRGSGGLNSGKRVHLPIYFRWNGKNLAKGRRRDTFRGWKRRRRFIRSSRKKPLPSRLLLIFRLSSIRIYCHSDRNILGISLIW